MGFSSDYIQYGTGNELIEDCELKPLKSIKPTTLSVTFLTKRGLIKATDTNVKRGIINKIKFKGWGKTAILAESSTANISDIAISGIEYPLIVEIINPDFGKKYNTNFEINLIIDESRCKNGDKVLVYYREQCFICKYTNNKLIDTAINIEDEEAEMYVKDRELNMDEAEILGAIYCKIEQI